MYIFKSCPKCRGDLAVERDGVTARLLGPETEFTCLQCGYYLQPAERRALVARIVEYLRVRRGTPQAASAA